MKATHAYVGRKKCGCSVAAVVDEPSDPKRTAKSVAEFVGEGYTIERVLVDDVRTLLKRCPHKTEQMTL